MNVVDSSAWLEYFADGANSAAQLSHELKLPMADSLILATARWSGAILWTQDNDFEGIEGVRYIGKG